MNNPVGWFEIYVHDMDRARAFYETVFLATLERVDATDLDMWAFPMSNGYGATGALVRMPGVNAGANSLVVYFSCADCAVEAGGTVVKSKFSIGKHGHIALVNDSEGNLIGLHSMQ
jgi:predicted enzyme related to lactoylglutathione lyase